MTKEPTNRELLSWWDRQPRGQHTCSDCGKIDDAAYVQPQHPFYAQGREGMALCGDCIGAHHRAAAAKRKAQLAAEPRCEVGGCKRRGAVRARGALLCKAHFERAQNRLQGFGIFGMAFDANRDAVLSLAGKD